VVAGVARAASGGAVAVILGTLAYVAVMVLAVRPLFTRVIGGWAEDRLPRGGVALVFGAPLLSCLATEAIGIHAVFGAFLLGAVIPHDSAVARTFSRQLEPVVTTLLLPAFFAFTGMRTRIDLLTGLDMWVMCGVIILVATAGKFGGTFVAARLSGLSWRPAAALGALMNTRGLMELIVLNVGHDLGVIPPALFAMMVMMALVTTMAAAPAVAWLLPRRDGGR
jgi:Kef-type K+ transport system membrane component KefB